MTYDIEANTISELSYVIRHADLLKAAARKQYKTRPTYNPVYLYVICGS